MTDFRAKLVPKDISKIDEIFGPPSLAGNSDVNILQPLRDTGGLVFPYTPVVNGVGGVANYQDWHFTHSNYQTFSYSNSAVNEIQLTAPFTAQTSSEARYTLAAIHFCRTMSKSYFGVESGSRAGVPPPVFYFNYLGTYQFKNVPVVISSFMYELSNDIDYVPVSYRRTQERRTDYSNVTNDITYVPTQVNLTITLKVQPNPYKMSKEFNLDKFKTGELLRNGKGYI